MILCTKLNYYYWAFVATLPSSFSLSLNNESQFTRSEAKSRSLVLHNPIQLRLEIQVIVFAAVGIESWSAIRAMIIWIHVFINCQFRFANPTKNCFRIPFVLIPNLPWMISCFFMTLITGIIFVTAFEFYSNNVKRRMIVLATGFTINRFPKYFDLVHFAAKVRNDLRKKKFL